MILSNASQLQDNISRFKQSYLKTLYVEIHYKHNWIYDDSICLMHRRPKLIH